MLKKILKEMSEKDKKGFVGFKKLDESYYEDEEVEMRKISQDMSSRESKATTELAKIIFDRLEANSRLSKKEIKPTKEKVMKELGRLLRIVKGKATTLSKKNNTKEE